MNRSNTMSIREFSRLTGIKRENLRFYDQIGLLTPEHRGENNYRYYSRHQLNTAYLITGLRQLDVSLEEIKQYSQKRTPEKMLELFAQQEKRIQKEIDRLREQRSIMNVQTTMIQDAMKHGRHALFLIEREREPIFLCPLLPAEIGDDDGEIIAYEYAAEHGVNFGYPFAAVISQTALKQIEPVENPIIRYYFKAKKPHNGYKPAGLYVVAYAPLELWDTDIIHRQVLDFVKQNNLKICGDAYEECPLDEMTISDPDEYCIRMEIPVVKQIKF